MNKEAREIQKKFEEGEEFLRDKLRRHFSGEVNDFEEGCTICEGIRDVKQKQIQKIISYLNIQIKTVGKDIDENDKEIDKNPLLDKFVEGKSEEELQETEEKREYLYLKGNRLDGKLEALEQVKNWILKEMK